MDDLTTTSLAGGTQGKTPQELTPKERADAVAHLLDDWLADTSGYDENAWSVLSKGIESSRLSSRKRLRG